MVEMGGRPILWHILKLYSHHGINDFVICCGYKGYVIKEYFANYFLHSSDVTFHMRDGHMEVHRQHAEPWRVTLVDTGETTNTGGRLKRVASLPRCRAVLLYLWRWPCRCGSHCTSGLPPKPWQTRHGDSGSATGALWKLGVF